jgi:hypothetical protein
LGSAFQRVRQALLKNPAEYAPSFLKGDTVSMEVDGASVEITPQDVEVKMVAREGWTLASDGGYVVALSTTLTDMLRLEGRARELVRQYNDLRKSAGFRVEDLMNATWTGSDGWLAVFDQFADYIKAETLAANLERTSAVPEGATSGTLVLDGSDVLVSVRPAVGTIADANQQAVAPAPRNDTRRATTRQNTTRKRPTPKLAQKRNATIKKSPAKKAATKRKTTEPTAKRSKPKSKTGTRKSAAGTNTRSTRTPTTKKKTARKVTAKRTFS